MWMFYLYMNGPVWLGFWNSKPLHDICTSMVENAALDSNFWVKHMDECIQLIENNFQNYCFNLIVFLTIAFVTYIIGMVTYFIMLWGCSFFFVKPIMTFSKIAPPTKEAIQQT